MTFSKLMYIRNLVKEAYKIEKLKQIEYGKARMNAEKIALLEQTYSEVKTERKIVSAEVEEWITQTLTSKKFQSEMRNFFLKGNDAISKNFHRDVESLLGENKYYKYDKK